MVYSLIFKTENDNFYIYDNNTRCVLPITNYSIKNEYIKNNMLVEERILKQIKKDYKKIKLFEKTDYEEFQKLEIDTCGLHVRKKGVDQLVLMITEDCNFRCKYCIYSENYSYSRNHTHKYMSWKVAKKAVDYFMTFNENSLESNPFLTPCVGFYGGEALLNWKLIVMVIDYIEENYRTKFEDLVYSITTNGSLLDEEKIEYLLEHKVFINISVDGDKDNHDRNRVYTTGKPTYNKVISNIRKLEKAYLKRKASNEDVYEYQLIMTYDNNTKIKQIANIAAKSPELYSHFSRINKVRDIETSYYDNQEKPYRINMEITELLNLCAKEGKRNPIGDIFYRQQVLTPALNTQFSPNILGGTCIPGSKIAVSAEGTFYMCEKMDYQSPIGNIDKGIDFQLQKEYLCRFIKMKRHFCKECNLTNICTQCYSQCSSGGGNFKINKNLCEGFKRNIANRFALYYTAHENGIDII